MALLLSGAKSGLNTHLHAEQNQQRHIYNDIKQILFSNS
jgi:hypothetical protein